MGLYFMCFPSLRDPKPVLPISIVWGKKKTASYILASFTAVYGKRSTLELLLCCGWKQILKSEIGLLISIHTVAARVISLCKFFHFATKIFKFS